MSNLRRRVAARRTSGLLTAAAALIALALSACGPAPVGAAGPTSVPAATAASTSASPAAARTPAPASPTSAPQTRSSAPHRSSSAPGTTAATATAHARAGSALTAVATLQVKGRAPMTGYDRKKFGSAWSDIDRNGCDQRNDVLRRDLIGITVKAGTRGCTVLSGTLHDPYTGLTVAFHRSSSSYSPVQIDHVVALGDAWAMGAWRWSDGQRRQLANDPLDLLAVDAHYNMSKGAGDAATWLPPNKGARCDYIARQVAVKVKYRLAVTGAERDAMKRVLSTCPSKRLPASSIAPLGGEHTAAATPRTTAPKPKTTHHNPAPRATRNTPAPRHTGAGSGSSLPTVHPGAFCAPAGAHGHTIKGTAMVCSVAPGQDRARWRSAG